MGLYLDLKKSIQRDLIQFSLLYLTDSQSNSAFPDPTSVDVGKTCYRSDLDKLYALKQDVTELGKQWVEVEYDYFFLDFDAHAQVQELPNHHLIGTKGITIRSDEHFVEVDLLLVLSIFGDTNFVVHDIAMDHLFQRYLPTQKIPVYAQSNGQHSGDFIVKNGTEIMGIVKADQRPIQFVSIALNTDRTVSL